MNVKEELIRIFGLTSEKEIAQDEEVIGQGGYLSFRQPAIIRKAATETPLHVFVKYSDDTRSELDDLQDISSHFCRTECIFYGFMAPVLERVMEQFNIEPVFPRMFGQKICDKSTILVMEDMTKQGFNIVSRPCLNVDEAYCVVRALARLQAAFWIARTSFNNELNSVLFGRESPLSDGFRKSGIDFKQVMENNEQYFFDNLPKHAKSVDDETVIRDYVSNFIKILVNDATKGLPELTDEPIGLTHGDLWLSNFMFKGAGDAVICRLFDWQFWDIGLFGFDLGLLMLTSLPTETLQEHVDKIPAEFYRTFKEVYEAKTGDPAAFTEEAARGNMRQSLFFATFWLVATSSKVWDSGRVDVPSILANAAFLIRTKRATLPFEENV